MLQVLRQRRIRMCTIDSAPRLSQSFRTACSVLQKELVDETLVPQPFPGDAPPDMLPSLPKLAKATLNLAVYGAPPVQPSPTLPPHVFHLQENTMRTPQVVIRHVASETLDGIHSHTPCTRVFAARLFLLAR